MASSYAQTTLGTTFTDGITLPVFFQYYPNSELDFTSSLAIAPSTWTNVK